MRADYGDPDVIEVRQTFNDSLQAREWEMTVLRRLRVLETDRWLNKTDRPCPTMLGKKHSEESKVLIGLGNAGKIYSDESLANIRNGVQRRASNMEWRANVRNGVQKRLSNPVWRTNFDSAIQKRTSNMEWRANRSRAMLRQPKTTCPHCGRDFDNLNYKKWHGDKCKMRHSTEFHEH